MADTGVRKIWIQYKTPILESKNNVVRCIEVREGEDGREVKRKLTETFHLDLTDQLVLKLRNHRGSLIPISGNLTANTRTVPYVLEVVGVHENVKAKLRTVKVLGYNNTMKDKLSEITSRIEKLEAAAPHLDELRNAKINHEMKEMEQMLQFLSKRLDQADDTHWKGMFKKNPLW